MRIDIVAAAEFSSRAAHFVREALEAALHRTIGLPTGRTPLGVYAELRREAGAGSLDLRQAEAFAIDELHGVASAHPATNASYLQRELPTLSGQTRVMDSAAPDGDRECAQFAAAIAEAGGLDVVVLGIGHNGHIAFNEPGSSFDSRARRVRLDDSTRAVYAPSFGSLEEVPRYGLTLGIADLLAARRLILLATGLDKADALVRALERDPDEATPASALQLHGDVTVLLDEAAASKLH
jgi:glucosamine-6-phosphate deaminase